MWLSEADIMYPVDSRMMAFSFTLAKISVYGIKFNILMTALTDFETGKHHYGQQAIFFGKDVIVTRPLVGVDGQAEMHFAENKLALNMQGEEYALRLDMDAVKPRVWHCENGVLQMGIPNQFTYYWSYTNLAVAGELTLNGKKHQVNGKGWFDRQGGPYNPIDNRTQWEWFSLRFYDDEEVMLFSFPQDDYRDGTYINRQGRPQRLNEYTITPLDFTKAGGFKFSFGWQVHMPGIKDEEYTIRPKIDGQLNLFYYELLAEICDRRGEVVGYCVVELLPGVYNKSNPLNAFANVK